MPVPGRKIPRAAAKGYVGGKIGKFRRVIGQQLFPAAGMKLDTVDIFHENLISVCKKRCES